MAQEGGATTVRRRHDMDVEDEGYMKDFVVILFFGEVPFVLFDFSFNVKIPFRKKIIFDTNSMSAYLLQKVLQVRTSPSNQLARASSSVTLD
jgi:hypothetical protein